VSDPEPPAGPEVPEAHEAHKVHEPHEAPRSLWRNPSFNSYWLGRVASDFGDTLAVIALPLVILHLTGSLVWMGMITALQSVGGWLGALAATAIADRFDRKAVLIAADVAQAVLYGLLTLAGMRGLAQTRDLVAICTPVLAALAAVFDATSVPFLDQVLASPGHRMSANARIQATRSLAGLAAPLSLGWLVDRGGIFATLGLDAASFAFSAITLALAKAPHQPTPDAPRAGTLRELSGGFRFIFASRVFLAVVVLSAVFRALGSSANDLMIFQVTENLAMPATTVGTLVMAIGVGDLVGSLLVTRVRRRFGFGAPFLGSFVFGAAALAILGWTVHLTTMTFAAGLYGASFMFFHVPSLTLRQELPPRALQGRVAAATGVIFVTATGLGAAGGSVLGAHLGVPWTMTILAFGCVVVFVVGLCSPARARNPAAG
jgi:MFS family permease